MNRAIRLARGSKVRIIPVKLNPAADLPYGLGAIQSVPWEKDLEALAAWIIRGESSILLTQPIRRSDHFVRRLRHEELHELDWLFIDRPHILQPLISWMRTEKSGLAFLTGPPGSGKSTILAWLVTISERVAQEIACKRGVLSNIQQQSIPDIGAIDVAINLKDMRSSDVALAVIGQLGLESPSEPRLDTYLCESIVRSALRQSKSQSLKTWFDKEHAYSDDYPPPDSVLTLIFDSLDEAASSHISAITQFLRDLSSIDGVLVVVGARSTLDRNSGRGSVGPGLTAQQLGVGTTIRHDMRPALRLHIESRHSEAETQFIGSPAEDHRDVEEFLRRAIAAGEHDSLVFRDLDMIGDIAREVAVSLGGNFRRAKAPRRDTFEIRLLGSARMDGGHVEGFCFPRDRWTNPRLYR